MSMIFAAVFATAFAVSGNSSVLWNDGAWDAGGAPKGNSKKELSKK